MKVYSIGRDDERKLLQAISQQREERNRHVFLRFFGNVAFFVIAATAICVASMSDWSSLALGAGGLFAGLLIGYVAGWFDFAHRAHDRWLLVVPHLNMESVAARLKELGA